MTFFRSALAALSLSTALSFPGLTQAQQITVGLSLPENVQGFDFVNGMYRLFAQEVEANSDMTVNIVYGGALGNPADRINQMRRGLLEMTEGSDGNYAAIFPDIMVLNLPFLFPDEKTAWTVLDGPMGDDMAADILEKTGIRVLGWWESGGFKHFSANRSVESPAEFAGLKIRVLGPLATIPVTALGASAAPISFGELYTALRTGVVDGQDNAVSVFNMVNLYEVQSHLIMSGHVYAFGPFGISEAFFKSLTPEQKKVVEDAAAKAIEYNRTTSRAVEAEALAFAESKGVTVVRLTEEQRDAFRQVMQPAAMEWLRANLDRPELIEKALAAVEAAN